MEEQAANEAPWVADLGQSAALHSTVQSGARAACGLESNSGHGGAGTNGIGRRSLTPCLHLVWSLTLATAGTGTTETGRRNLALDL